MSVDIEEKIIVLAKNYREALKSQIDTRVLDMEVDDTSHYLLYRVLGISEEEGRLIDLYQNKGRFLYKYAGSFLEEATRLCFVFAFPNSGAIRIPNTLGSRPKTFEIDCLIGKEDAIEVKWRDATTDGDHITKEHTRIKVISAAGYKPVRIMFYYPNRAQAIRIQQSLETLYAGVHGEYYFGKNAWEYVNQKTGIDLKGIIEKLPQKI